ncbi:hypothetical protein [Salinibius halmophilus]|uniref:hypothetical protein n=1 Tax=Salinibius halmophilus TaxID=1853216 RepID=UPI000E674EAE|nr:hypothetical protein [Salinibius halmophilus]
MKALKIASLTALAAAISAQAAADFYITKGADITVTGSLYTEAVVDITNEQVFVTNQNGDSEAVWAKLNLTNNVFNATLVAEPINASADLKDVTVTDGNIKFGQVGGLGNTHEYFGLHEDVSQESYGVDAGIRLSNLAGVSGLSAQLEGAGSPNRNSGTLDDPSTAGVNETAEGNDFGLGVAYSSDVADGVTLHANVAARQAHFLAADEDNTVAGEDFGGQSYGLKTHVGLGVTAKAGPATIKAVVNNQNQNEASTTDVGAEVVVVTGPITTTAAVVTLLTDAETDPLHALGKVAYSQDGLGAHVQYKFKTTEADEDKTGDEFEAGVSYSLTQDMITYAAESTFSAGDILDENEDDSIAEKLATTVSAAYKSSVGATYKAAFTNETLAENEANKLTLSASYSF